MSKANPCIVYWKNCELLTDNREPVTNLEYWPHSPDRVFLQKNLRRIIFYKRSDRVKIKKVGNNTALYVMDQKGIHVLNETALFIWEVLQGTLYLRWTPLYARWDLWRCHYQNESRPARDTRSVFVNRGHISIRALNLLNSFSIFFPRVLFHSA